MHTLFSIISKIGLKEKLLVSRNHDYDWILFKVSIMYIYFFFSDFVYIIIYFFFFHTIIGARHVLDPAEVSLHPDAYTVILIWQLQSSRRIIIKGLYLAGNSSEVLEASLFGTVNRTASYLRDTDFPRTRKRTAARDESQSNRIGLSDACVHVHCKKYLICQFIQSKFSVFVFKKRIELFNYLIIWRNCE